MGWVITYKNLSSKDLKISRWGGQYQIGLDEESHLPKSVLEPGQSDYLEMDQDLSTLDQGPNEYWQNVTGGQALYLWVRICVPFQMLGIGYSPYWNFAISNNGSKVPDWGKNYEGDSPVAAMGSLRISFSGSHSHTSVSTTAIFEDA